MPSSQSPLFNALPGHITTSFILPYVTSSDWLNFRAASRACYISVHGSGDDVWQFVCPTCQATKSPTNQVCASGKCGNDVVILSKSPDGIKSCEKLWKLALVRDYQFQDADDGHDELLYKSIHPRPIEPVGDGFLSTKNLFTASNLFVSWMHWRKLEFCVPPFGRDGISGPYFLRAGSMWRKIEDWCNHDGSEHIGENLIRQQLVPGGRWMNCPTSRDIQSDPLSAFHAVYAFYAGQEANDPPGFFGQYQIGHDFMVDTMWCEPQFVSIQHQHQTGVGTMLREYILIAEGAGLKSICLDPATGQTYYVSNGKQLVATPCEGGVNRSIISGLKSEQPVNPLDGKDSILRWFEEHANRLEQGHYSACRTTYTVDEKSSSLDCILRYPLIARAPYCSRAVTYGVETVASAMYAEEIDGFVISIDIRVLNPDDGEEYKSPKQRGFDTCELFSPKWKTSRHSPNPDQTSVEEVRCKEVVNGYRPVLSEVGYSTGSYDCPGVFSYQTVLESDMQCTMEGYFQCMPGSIDKPLGAAFQVRVAPLPLVISPFLY